METEHTTGLWETGSLMSRVEVNPPGWRVPMCIADCGTKYAPESTDEQCANARLIAAAPDLLEDLSDFILLGATIAARLDIMARETPPNANGAKIYPCAALRQDLKELLAKARADIAKTNV